MVMNMVIFNDIGINFYSDEEEKNKEEQKKELLSAVKERDWPKVLEIFRKYPKIQGAKINISHETALHVAIAHGAKEDIVGKLIDEIITANPDAIQTLSAEDKDKNTPLHCAASRGSQLICRRIIKVAQHQSQSLLGKRNNERETPLFVAALNGKQDAFLYLYAHCKNGESWRKKNGDTVLHCTIEKKHFELALKIIYLYGNDITASINEKGITPLDILASTPSAFRSGTRLEWWQKLCYHYEKKFVPPVPSIILDVDHLGEDQQVQEQYASPRFRMNTLAFIREKKERHKWVAHIMDELVKQDTWYHAVQPQKEMEELRRIDTNSPNEENEKDKAKESTALLTAAKNGLTELVEKILEEWKGSFNDKTKDNKNVVHVAIEERQSHMLQVLRKHDFWNDLIIAECDGKNTALHLVAKLSEQTSWEIPKSAMHMQREVKWFEYVRRRLPDDFIDRRNEQGETPSMIFKEAHKELDKESKKWLKESSTAYTVASTIVTSVTFSACYQGPGGNNTHGKPLLRGDLAFDTFALAVLFAFSFSITALAAFMAVYSSQKQPKQYLRDIPLKLLFGLASLFVSMFSTLVAFYAAHSYEVNHGEMRKVHFPLYAITLLPACFYLATQIPLFRNLLKYSLSEVPPGVFRSRGDDVPTTTEKLSPTPKTPLAQQNQTPETSAAEKSKTPGTSAAEKSKTPETQSQPEPQPQATLKDKHEDV